MFRYRVTIDTRDEQNHSHYSWTFISRLTPIKRTGFTQLLKRLGRQHPDATSFDVTPVEESEYLRLKADGALEGTS